MLLLVEQVVVGDLRGLGVLLLLLLLLLDLNLVVPPLQP